MANIHYSCNSDIAILMAVYNGAAYIEEQIKSILNQTANNWHLYVRDDGSTDYTSKILLRYAKEYDCITIIEDNLRNLGPKRNFMQLVSYVDAAYYMFCDQDDIWKQTKVERSFSEMKNLEQRYSSKPVLVFTNASVVDSNLNVIIDNYWSHIGLDINRMNNLCDYAIVSFAPGCTMMFNNQTKMYSIPMKDNAIMHDWWIGVSVYLNNGIVYGINSQEILYRKHGNNVTGDLSVPYTGCVNRIVRFFDENKQRRRLLSSIGISFFDYWVHKLRLKHIRSAIIKNHM